MSNRASGGSGIARAMPSQITVAESVPTITAETGVNLTRHAIAVLLPALVTDDPALITTVQIKVRLATPGPGTQIRAAIFADDAGAPGALIMQSAPIPSEAIPDTTDVITTWQMAQQALPAGTYHVGLVTDIDWPDNPLFQVGGTSALLAALSAAATSAGPWTNVAAQLTRPWWRVTGSEA